MKYRKWNAKTVNSLIQKYVNTPPVKASKPPSTYPKTIPIIVPPYVIYYTSFTI